MKKHTLLALLFLTAPAFSAETESVRVTPSAEVEAGLYGETGRLSIRLAFRVEEDLEVRYGVTLHVTDVRNGVAVATADHVPPVPTDGWAAGETVRYTVTVVVPVGDDGARPEVLVLVGLKDPRQENGYRGRLELDGETPFEDRRYLVARIGAAKGRATSEQLRGAARERADLGEKEAAYRLLEEALVRGPSLAEKLAVTADLLALTPPVGDEVSGPEKVRIDGMVAAEKLRWLRDRASELLKAKEDRLALRVMERIGGVVSEERNTKVVGEPTGEKRAEKDVVDVKSRLLRQLPDEQQPEFKMRLASCDSDPKKLLAAAKAEIKRGRMVFARKLLVEIRIDMKAPEKLKSEANELFAEVERRILYDLTPEEERRLPSVTDHPAFHRLETVAGSWFIYLGPEKLVRAIPRASSYRLDVACALLTDLFGRSPVAPGQRIIVYYKETYSGPATGGGRQIVIGDADPENTRVRVDNGLYYHELTHCVDDTRPVHDYKRGLTEGLANLGAVFVKDMFAGTEGKFESLSRAGRAQFKRHHLDRENAFWLIPAYAPSEGMLTEILARHAPAEGDHVDWPKLGVALRRYRESQVKSPRTHRIMAHFGNALAHALGAEVWATLVEFRFPVTEETGAEIDLLAKRESRKLMMLAGRRDASGLIAFADRAAPRFAASRARYAALGILGRTGRGDSEAAAKLRSALGVIDEMHVIGPFYPKGGPGLAQVFPPGEEIDFAVEYVTPQGVARWRVPKVMAQHYAKMDARGAVMPDYGYPDRAVTYAVAHVTVPEATGAIAWIGANDEVALWVNGRHVERNHGRRPLVPDWERWPMALEAGRNRIVLKIANEHGSTGFCLRLTDRDGRSIPGMKEDLDPPDDVPPPDEPKWSSAFTDTMKRRSLGRRYDVVAGKFSIRRKILTGEANGKRPGWRPFSVRPGFPQDRPAALVWLKPSEKEPPADFIWRVTLARPEVPKIVLTWDGEGDELPLSGWSLVLVPKRGRFTARLERYDYLHYLKVLDAPGEWKEPVLTVKRVGGLVTVTIGDRTVFDGVSAPPLAKRGFGIAVWGPAVEIGGLGLAFPK